jgi:TPR repeat protein
MSDDEARSELTTLLERGAPYAPEQLRRIAELMELLYSDEKARPWWERAAEAGDRDAVDYLEVLKEEQESK